MRRLLTITLRVFLSVVLCHTLIFPPQAFAAGHTLYITPTSTEVAAGTNFVVNVKGYVGSRAVSKASGSITYPTNILQVVSTSPDNSSYGVPSISQGAGSVNFSASTGTDLSGQVHIFTITFRAIGSGTASVGFSGSSAINSDAAGTVRKGGSFKVNAPTPAPTCPSGQFGAPPNCYTPPPPPPPAPTPTPTPNPSPSPADTVPDMPVPDIPTTEDEKPTVDTTGIITDVSVHSQYTSSTVSWRTSKENVTTELTYGASKEDATTKATITKQSDGTYQATIPKLQPGTRSYFAISGTLPDSTTGSYIGTIITKGYPVTLSLQNNNAPASSAAIKIGQRSYTATDKGTLNLALAEGVYSGTVTVGGIAKAIKFTVEAVPIPEDNSAPKQQAFSFSFTVNTADQAAAGGSSMFTRQSVFEFIAVLLGGTVVLVLLGVGFMAYRRRKFELEASGGISSGSRAVVVNDGFDWDMHQKNTPQATPPYQAPPPPMPYVPQSPAASLLDEEPKDMFELAREQDMHQKNTPQS